MTEERQTERTEHKRGYELGKRLEQMDETRRAVLQAARDQLERAGYRQFSMASLAADSAVTRQTIHNLFGTKQQLLEALFDSIALSGGMEQMRSVMSLKDPSAMLEEFVRVFCAFWAANQLFFRRIHGIGAIDPDFGDLIDARNERRRGAAGRIAKKWKSGSDAIEAAAALTALTSFEFYDATARHGISAAQTEAIVLKMAHAAVLPDHDK
jgi:AcrR family transcriptional regulator